MAEMTDNDGQPCGVGTVEQHRGCIDGHFQKCNTNPYYDDDTQRFVLCSLSDCPSN